MADTKKAKTYEEQMQILFQHGCHIANPADCINKLSLINYYRLSAYFLPFRKNSKEYQEGTSFDQVFQIYKFDRKLRSILFGITEVIEISLRTRLSYLHAHQYGPLGYLEAQNFSTHHDHVKFINHLKHELQRNAKLPMVIHHNQKYNGKFPIWVVSELFTFGMSSYFYNDLYTRDQKIIAKQYQSNYKDLASWLRCLTDLRNICAHFGRLYYRIFSASPANIPLSEHDKRKLWGLMLVLKRVYPSKSQWESEILPSLAQLFNDYHHIINLDHLSFPNDWTQQLAI